MAIKTYIFRPRAEGARKILDPLEGGLPPLKSENRALPPLIADFRGGRPQDALLCYLAELAAEPRHPEIVAVSTDCASPCAGQRV